LGNFDGEENTAEAEDDRVSDRGNPDGCITEEEQRLNELDELERRRVDALEVEVFLLESRDIVADHIAHVERFGAKEEVGDELHTVCLSTVSSSINIVCLKSSLQLRESSRPSGSYQCDK
jgi:hypothetical protein